MAPHRPRPSATARPQYVRVGFACNDGDNGLFTGKVEAISISRAGESLDLELQKGRASPLTAGEDWIRIFRLKLETFGSKRWVGNWCWDEYVLAVPDAARLLKQAMAKYSSTGAEGNAACALCDLLDNGGRLAGPAAIEAALLRFGERVKEPA